jgi:sec-independent protein translocase protein TatA
MIAFLDPPEIVLLIVVVLVLFGGSQLPKLARNLGKAQQEFKQGLAEGQKSSGTQPPADADAAAKAEEVRKLEQRLAELKGETPPKTDA